jgi:hypothetical protein
MAIEDVASVRLCLDAPRLGCQKNGMVIQRTLHTTRFGVPCAGVLG